jgi:hypothetical protein
MRFHLRLKNHVWSWSCFDAGRLIEVGHGYNARSAWTDLQSRLYDL